jgi:hypothetical protein
MPEVLNSEGPMPADEPDLSIFENKSGLAEDLKFLASMPELCDVTFLVGETREPVCAVKVNNMKSASLFNVNSVVLSVHEMLLFVLRQTLLMSSSLHKPPQEFSLTNLNAIFFII